MVRSSLIAGALLTTMLAAGQSQAATSGDGSSAINQTKSQLQLVQGGGGDGDSAGRGPDTSKGAVPKNPPEFPTGTGNPGTAPIAPSPSNPYGTTGTGSGSSSAPDDKKTEQPGEYTPQTPGAPGTGLRSPGTESQGGSVRPEE